MYFINLYDSKLLEPSPHAIACWQVIKALQGYVRDSNLNRLAFHCPFGGVDQPRHSFPPQEGAALKS